MDVKPGVETSEFGLAKINVALGGASIVLGAVFDALGALSQMFPRAIYVGGALKAVGALVSVLTYLGYNRGRVAVKQEAMQANAIIATGSPAASDISAPPVPSARAMKGTLALLRGALLGARD